mmetsp:Transcript_27990/g.90366  ORF Transcript_27990/g.90366 Transcript_27990/m.90366 type:complete len:300 (-) Transcript_27990:411-1310(-)
MAPSSPAVQSPMLGSTSSPVTAPTCPGSVRTQAPVLWSHTRTHPSSPALTSGPLWNGPNPNPRMGAACPASVWSRRRVRRFHTCTTHRRAGGTDADSRRTPATNSSGGGADVNASPPTSRAPAWGWGWGWSCCCVWAAPCESTTSTATSSAAAAVVSALAAVVAALVVAAAAAVAAAAVGWENPMPSSPEMEEAACHREPACGAEQETADSATSPPQASGLVSILSAHWATPVDACTCHTLIQASIPTLNSVCTDPPPVPSSPAPPALSLTASAVTLSPWVTVWTSTSSGLAAAPLETE